MCKKCRPRPAAASPMRQSDQSVHFDTLHMNSNYFSMSTNLSLCICHISDIEADLVSDIEADLGLHRALYLCPFSHYVNLATSLYRGSYMSGHVLSFLINELIKMI